MSQDERDHHGDREPKSEPRIGRGSEGTLTGRGMTRENRERGLGGGGGLVYEGKSFSSGFVNRFERVCDCVSKGQGS